MHPVRYSESYVATDCNTLTLKGIEMRNAILFAALAMFVGGASAQPAAPKAPAVSAGTAAGTVCDMIGVVDGSVIVNGVEYDSGYVYAFAPAIPMADVHDNHKKWMKVLNAASKEQDKGGPYEAEISEYRSCDGGGAVKISDGSVWIKGMTLAGSTRVADEGLKQAKLINDRTKARAHDKNSTNHDHTKAKKIKRNDVGVKVRE